MQVVTWRPKKSAWTRDYPMHRFFWQIDPGHLSDVWVDVVTHLDVNLTRYDVKPLVLTVVNVRQRPGRENRITQRVTSIGGCPGFQKCEQFTARPMHNYRIGIGYDVREDERVCSA